jgi:glycosyltransferase involved in cell wall biosynthesis
MERQVAELSERLLARGHRVTVVARRCELERQKDLRWIRVPCPARPFSIAYPLFFLIGSLLTWARGEGLVHTTGAVVFNRADISTVHFCHHAFRSGTVLSRARRPGLLYRINGWVASRMSLLAERYRYRPARTGHLVAVSNGVARELVTHFPAMTRSVSVIPNGVDHGTFRHDEAARAAVRSELEMSEDDLVALFVGGDWERKGLRFALEAVAKSQAWHLLVVGTGDIPRFRRLASCLGAGERVHFTGQAARTEPYFAAADAFLLPSAYETFSLVTFEAAASGLPLLVTRVSGVEDMIRDGENGWFIEPDPDVIAGRLQELQTNDSLRRRMGQAAHATSACYGWAPVVEAYSHLYDALSSRDNDDDR